MLLCYRIRLPYRAACSRYVIGCKTYAYAYPHLFAFLDAFCYLVTNRVSDMLIKKSLFERKETWIYLGHGFILVNFPLLDLGLY